MTKRSFHPPELYPEINEIAAHFSVIRAEALAARAAMAVMEDNRVRPGVWHVLPLLPEEEDRSAIPEEVWRANRRLAPRSTAILSSIPGLKAFAFSSLAPGGHIQSHKHESPCVTAALCLQDGGDSYLLVAGERRDYRDGEVIIFDYTLEHEVFNLGDGERIVLLVLFDNRWCTSK